jgi:hypothetical protein
VAAASKSKTQALPPEVNAAGRVALRALIDARWESDAEAARALGVSKATVCSYFKGAKGSGARLSSAVFAHDMTTGLVMMGASIPALRSVPYLAEVAARLSEEHRLPRDVAAWACLQAIQLGRGQTPEDLLASARSLACARLAPAPPAPERNR